MQIVMIFYKLFFIVAIHLFNTNFTTAEASDNFVNDYCWRDYDGITPSDALKAGIDRNGMPIYIGQTLYDNKLIPGKIHENVSAIHIEFFQAFTINETIKILCSNRPDRFQWFKTRTEDFINIKEKHLFEGGYEVYVKTYIGRAESHGELTVGKVICYPTHCIPLTTIENGTWYPHDEYEILTYNATITHSNISSAYSPSLLTYVFIVLGIAVLIGLLVELINRCYYFNGNSCTNIKNIITNKTASQ